VIESSVLSICRESSAGADSTDVNGEAFGITLVSRGISEKAISGEGVMRVCLWTREARAGRAVTRHRSAAGLTALLMLVEAAARSQHLKFASRAALSTATCER
jgi:hypothetical protein